MPSAGYDPTARWGNGWASICARMVIALVALRHRPRVLTVSAGPGAGLRLFLDTERGGRWAQETAAGQFDPWLSEIAASLRPRVAWDVGAHVGYHASILAAMGTGQVEAFEPNPANLRRLRRHLGLNPALAPRIRPRAFALADRNGAETFLFHRDVDGRRSSVGRLEGGARLYSDAHDLGFSRRRVRCCTGDALVFREGWPAPELIKLDVEGGKLRVLAGIRNVLAVHRPVLLIEFHGADWRHRAAGVLEAAGYRLHLLAEASGSIPRAFVHAQPTDRRP